MKKNILLVLPRVPGALEIWNVPPIGILYVSSSLKKQGFNVYTLNLMLSDEPITDIIKEKIQEFNIDVIGTGDLVLNYRAVKEVIDAAKDFKPDIVTIIGGGLVTHSPKEAMKIINNADYGIIGEGEFSMGELIFALENNDDISKVKGIIYRSHEELICTETRVDIENLDSLPFPDYEGFDYFEFSKKLSVNGKIDALLTTSRSCPFNCTFCSSSGGSKYRQRSLDNIFEELEYLINKYHVNQIYLNDELFAVNAERVNEFCERVKKYNVEWFIYLRVSRHIQLELLRKMKDCGCMCVFYGLESASNKILKSMQKGTTVEEILRALEVTKEAGLKAKGAFIFGDTEESQETINITLSWLEKHFYLLENITIVPIILFPGSALYHRAVRNGRIEDTVKFIKEGCPLINPSDYLSEEEYFLLVNQKLPQFAVKLHNKNSELYKKILQQQIFANKNNKRYIHRFICKECNEETIQDLSPTMIYQSTIACSHCNKKYEMFLSYLYFTTFEMKINKMFTEYKTAIWGCGETLEYLWSFNSYLNENDVLLIDSNLSKQKMDFHGKRVYAPDVLKRSDIDTIIFCVGNMNYSVICNIVRKEYSHVKNLYWIYNIGLLN